MEFSQNFVDSSEYMNFNYFDQMVDSTENVYELKNSTFEIIVGDLIKIFKENSTIE